MINRINSEELLENISQCVISTKLDGTVTYWNQACVDIFGYTKEEMVDEPLSKIYPFVAEEQYYGDLQKLRDGREVQGQWKSITKDGSIIWIDVHAKPLVDEDNEPKAIIASAHNINEQKKIEQELEENKAQAQAILERTVDGIITIDKNGKILNSNHSASRIFGYSKEEIVNKNIKILIPESYNGKYDTYINHFSNDHQKQVIGFRRELTGRRKDGSNFPIELSISEVKWRDSKIFTVVVNDISERRRLQSEILRISEEERRNLGQDLHDGLGQMLTGIRLITQNLAQKLKHENTPGSEEVQEISNLIKEADEYAKTLARGLVSVDFEKEGLKVALKQLGVQVEKLFGVHCRVEYDENIEIHNNMKSMHLYRIAQESISNAVKHGKASNIDIKLKSVNRRLELSVKDDGIGFEESQKTNGGMGIHIMRYRASMLSGRLEIFQTGDEKTSIVCSIPHKF